MFSIDHEYDLLYIKRSSDAVKHVVYPLMPLKRKYT